METENRATPALGGNSMYPRKEFHEREHDYSTLLRRKLEEVEEMI